MVTLQVLRISAVDASSLLDREFIKQRMLNEAGDPNPLGNGEDQNLGKKKHKTGKSEPDVAALGITNSLHPEATPGISEDLESQPQKSNRNVIGGMKQVDVLKDVRARLLHGIKVRALPLPVLPRPTIRCPAGCLIIHAPRRA